MKHRDVVRLALENKAKREAAEEAARAERESEAAVGLSPEEIAFARGQLRARRDARRTAVVWSLSLFALVLALVNFVLVRR